MIDKGESKRARNTVGPEVLWMVVATCSLAAALVLAIMGEGTVVDFYATLAWGMTIYPVAYWYEHRFFGGRTSYWWNLNSPGRIAVLGSLAVLLYVSFAEIGAGPALLGIETVGFSIQSIVLIVAFIGAGICIVRVIREVKCAAATRRRPNIAISPEDRAYYRATWGFDPFEDLRQIRRNGEWGYEAEFSLVADPELQAAGVTVRAIVVLFTAQAMANVIVFRAGKQEAIVSCTHTVVYRGTLENALDWASTPPADAQVIEPVILPIYEHFAALKSYVAGIAEIGFRTLLAAAYAPGNDATPTDLPFGFNAAMQHQIIFCLKTVAPTAARAILADWFIHLVETVPADWLATRAELLSEIFPITDLLEKLAENAPDWLESQEAKITCFRPIASESVPRQKRHFFRR